MLADGFVGVTGRVLSMEGAAEESDVGEQHQAVRDHHVLVAELPCRKGRADYG